MPVIDDKFPPGKTPPREFLEFMPERPGVPMGGAPPRLARPVRPKQLEQEVAASGKSPVAPRQTDVSVAGPEISGMTVAQLRDHITNVLGELPAGNTKTELVRQINQARLREIRFQNKIAPSQLGPAPGGLPPTVDLE